MKLKPPTPLPEVESCAREAWRVGFYEGALIWCSIGVAIGVMLAKAVA